MNALQRLLDADIILDKAVEMMLEFTIPPDLPPARSLIKQAIRELQAISEDGEMWEIEKHVINVFHYEVRCGMCGEIAAVESRNPKSDYLKAYDKFVKKNWVRAIDRTAEPNSHKRVWVCPECSSGDYDKLDPYR